MRALGNVPPVSREAESDGAARVEGIAQPELQENQSAAAKMISAF